LCRCLQCILPLLNYRPFKMTKMTLKGHSQLAHMRIRYHFIACSTGGSVGSSAIHEHAKREARKIRLQSHHCLCSSNHSPGERFLLIGCFKPCEKNKICLTQVTGLHGLLWLMTFLHLPISYKFQPLNLLFCSSLVFEGHLMW